MQWTNIKEIIELLEDNYPYEDVLSLRLHEIEELVMSLSDFEDFDTKPSKALLKRIFQSWLELRAVNE